MDKEEEKKVKFVKLLSNCKVTESEGDENIKKVLQIIFKQNILPEKEYFHVSELPRLAIEYINNHPTDENITRLINLLQVLESEINQQKYQYTYFNIFKVLVRIIDKFPDKVQDLTKKWALRRWINICLDANADYNHRAYFKKYKIDPEEAVEKIILDKNKNLKPEFKKEEWKPEKLTDWFLNRYDLQIAYKLIKGLFWVNLDKSKTASKKECPTLIFICTLIVIVFFLWAYFDFSDLLVWGKRAWLPISQWGYFHFVELVPVFSLLFVLSSLIIDLIWEKNLTLSFKLIIPRLLGGILIGYLPILVGEEVWKFVVQVDVFEGFFIISISIIFCFYYIFTEIKNVVYDTRIAFFRGLRIWLIGILESFFVGIVVLDLFARAFVRAMDNPYTLVPYSGLLGGTIYPKVLLIYFPLALLIGIFVQIIWEEKPITQPL